MDKHRNELFRAEAQYCTDRNEKALKRIEETRYAAAKGRSAKLCEGKAEQSAVKRRRGRDGSSPDIRVVSD